MNIYEKDKYTNPFSAYINLDFFPVKTFHDKIIKARNKFFVFYKLKLKKNKKKSKFPITYILQHSNIIYTCNISKLSCVCSKGSKITCCNHLAFVLETYLNLDYFLIYMIFNDRIAQDVYLENISSLSKELIPVPKKELADKIFNALKK